ncbi:hypothetical protein ADEAN_000965200 [Angomonas deanei]|uniref:Uncharacterized protein n=1 Tax=Angomonas deanei TaxID=59799 RepID=A0A7G2CUN0_9TRYP|nr:hypothetical protein ADEAN_000965200 [Angomonas deanei]
MRDVKLQSRNKVAQHKEAIQDLINRQNLLTERGKRLTNYVGLVDRFTSFVDVETVKRQAEVNATAEGEVLLVAAFYTLISFRHNRKTVDATVLDMLAALKEMNVETPNNIYEDAIPLLYLSHAKQTDAFLPSAFPFRHQMCLLAISERLSNRWLLIGGSCPLFEKFVTIFLKTQCTGVTSISASIPPRQLKTQLLQSMQNGEGVILHGMHSEEHFQLIEHLGELAEKLNEQRRRRDLETKISFRVFDKVVEVHPRFYLVCLSPSLYLSGESSHLHYDSVYLDEPIPDSFVLDSVIIHNLPSADQKKDVKDEILQRKIHLCEEVAALRRVHGEACAKLSGDLDLVAEKGDDLLEEAERLINDVDYEDTQLTQLTMQIQNLKKKQWEMWGALKPALGGIMESLQFIEMSKFGRPWSNALLEPYFSVLTRLTKPLASRISPQSLSDLSVEHQCFYILLNYMERLGEAFANGWPSILRGWFSLVFCAGAVLRTDILTAQRGVLYSSEVELLTETQYKMMCQLVTSDDYAALYNKGDVSQLKELMVEAYKQSGDDLLVQLANQFSSGDQPATESEIGELFLAVLNLNFVEAEERAKSLYSTFFRSVKDAKTVQMGLEQPFQSTIRDMFSERDHFANAVRGMGAGRAPLLPLHILHHGTEHCVPLHFPCSSILPVLITLKVQAAALKYVFHVRTVTCTEDLHEIRRVLVRLSGGEDRAKGTFLCIHLDIPPASLQEETSPHPLQSPGSGTHRALSAAAHQGGEEHPPAVLLLYPIV